MTGEEEKEISAPKRTAYYTKFRQVLENKKPVRASVFTHPCPDPDAIGSMMAMKWVLDKFDVESSLFYTGAISHPQNRSLVNLLDPDLIDIAETQLEIDESCLQVLVDTVPDHAGMGGEGVSFDLVIDHHKDNPNGSFKGVYVNLKAGSCCGTIYSLMEKLDLEFETDNDNDSKIATAMMVGITTDTEFLMSDDTTEHEFNAWSKLFPYRDPIALKKIVNFERPKFWTEAKAVASATAVIEEGVGVVGMGLIPAKHRDMIADMSDEMVNWEDVNTAVAFAIVEGSRIEGSVRTKTASISVPTLCSTLGGKHGTGGGKLGKGAYRYDLAGASIDEDEDEETRGKLWELFHEKERKKIFKVIKNK